MSEREAQQLEEKKDRLRSKGISISLNINTIATSIVAAGVIAMIAMMAKNNERLIVLEEAMRSMTKTSERRLDMLEETVYGRSAKPYNPRP